jgi:hypothetical protein
VAGELDDLPQLGDEEPGFRGVGDLHCAAAADLDQSLFSARTTVLVLGSGEDRDRIWR